MKLVTTNLLNRFWKNGVKPIKDGLANKIDSSKIVKSTNITQEGFLMDGKHASDAFAELNRNSRETLATGVTLVRCGKHRILHLFNASAADGAATTGLIATLPADDRPDMSIGSSAIVKGSATANLYVTVDINGKIMLWNKGAYQSASNAITATIDWYVS